MIPYGLEKLILDGLAVAKTRCIGYSGVATLEVPDGKQVVIYGLHYYFGFGFGKDINGNPNSDLSVTLESKKKTDNYTIKPTNNNITTSDVGETKIELYSMHFSDVRIRHAMFGGNLGVVDFGVLPANALEPIPPQGYGTTIPALRNIDLPTAIRYMPQGTPYSIQPISANSRNNYHIDVAAGVSEVPPPTLTESGFLVNVSYVEINLGYNNKVQ